jgi:AraC-like DNA-binding protein
VAAWDDGLIQIHYDVLKEDTRIVLIQIRVKREDRILLITQPTAFRLIFLFGGNCRLSINGNPLILHDRGYAGFSGTHDRCFCDFQKEILYLFFMIQYSASFFATEDFELKESSGYFYPRPAVCTRETLDDLSALIFPAYTETMDRFIRNEICRSLFVRFTNPGQTRLFQSAGVSLSEYSDFYQLRSQLLKQVTNILEYPDLMAAAGIRDTQHFRKTCRQLYGLNPTGYITEARMAHAQMLLKDPALSIKEIALGSGFPSTQYFDRVFLHYFGVTPKAFRQR